MSSKFRMRRRRQWLSLALFTQFIITTEGSSAPLPSPDVTIPDRLNLNLNQQQLNQQQLNQQRRLATKDIFKSTKSTEKEDINYIQRNNHDNSFPVNERDKDKDKDKDNSNIFSSSAEDDKNQIQDTLGRTASASTIVQMIQKDQPQPSTTLILSAKPQSQPVIANYQLETAAAAPPTMTTPITYYPTSRHTQSTDISPTTSPLSHSQDTNAPTMPRTPSAGAAQNPTAEKPSLIPTHGVFWNETSSFFIGDLPTSSPTYLPTQFPTATTTHTPSYRSQTRSQAPSLTPTQLLLPFTTPGSFISGVNLSDFNVTVDDHATEVNLNNDNRIDIDLSVALIHNETGHYLSQFEIYDIVRDSTDWILDVDLRKIYIINRKEDDDAYDDDDDDDDNNDHHHDHIHDGNSRRRASYGDKKFGRRKKATRIRWDTTTTLKQFQQEMTSNKTTTFVPNTIRWLQLRLSYSVVPNEENDDSNNDYNNNHSDNIFGAVSSVNEPAPIATSKRDDAFYSESLKSKAHKIERDAMKALRERIEDGNLLQWLTEGNPHFVAVSKIGDETEANIHMTAIQIVTTEENRQGLNSNGWGGKEIFGSILFGVTLIITVILCNTGYRRRQFIKMIEEQEGLMASEHGVQKLLARSVLPGPVAAASGAMLYHHNFHLQEGHKPPGGAMLLPLPPETDEEEEIFLDDDNTMDQDDDNTWSSKSRPSVTMLHDTPYVVKPLERILSLDSSHHTSIV